MPIKPIILIDISPLGEMKYQDPDLIQRFLLTFKPGTYQLKIEKLRKDRSNEQNRYMHGVVLKMILDEMGEESTEEEMVKLKNLMKSLFLRKQIHGFDTFGDTSDLSTVEMEEFLEKVRRWASATLNLYIPLPNEIDWSTITN